MQFVVQHNRLLTHDCKMYAI